MAATTKTKVNRDKRRKSKKRRTPETYVVSIMGDVVERARYYGYYAIFQGGIPGADEPDTTIMHIKTFGYKDAKKLGREFGKVLNVYIL